MKILTFFFAIITLFVTRMYVFADKIPQPQNIGLPGENTAFFDITLGKFTNSFILFVGALAVISLSYGGVLFITSFGEEEKIKKAKKVFLYSLIGILFSIASYTIVDIVNSLKIG